MIRKCSSRRKLPDDRYRQITVELQCFLEVADQRGRSARIETKVAELLIPTNRRHRPADELRNVFNDPSLEGKRVRTLEAHGYVGLLTRADDPLSENTQLVFCPELTRLAALKLPARSFLNTAFAHENHSAWRNLELLID